MKTFLSTYLYIKTHNITGLKYFGKTTNDPITYRGSGKYWQAHLKKHGNDVTTEVLGYYTDKEECSKIALEFSINNNICLLYTSPSPRDRTRSRMPSSA